MFTRRDNSKAPKDVRDLIQNPLKGSEEIEGILTLLYRQILEQISPTWTEYNDRMNRYLNDPSNGFGDDSKRKSSERSNLNKELLRGRMSWKVFLKAIRFWAPLKMRIEIQLTWRRNIVTSTGIDVNFDSLPNEIESAEIAETLEESREESKGSRDNPCKE